MIRDKIYKQAIYKGRKMGKKMLKGSLTLYRLRNKN